MSEVMKELSDVTVTLHSGEIKTFRMTASPKIARYLSESAVMTGALVLYNETESMSIPWNNVHDFTIKAVTIEQYNSEQKG